MKTGLFFCGLWVSTSALAQTTLIPGGAQWRYNDQGLNLGTAWTLPSYSDASWPMGSAELGYGDGDENTSVSYGGDSDHKHITTYFRKTFYVASPSAYSGLQINLLRDDGAVIYINGTEVARSNMPGGSINYTTLADGTIGWPFEDDWHTYTASALHLVAGNNTIAVEIHQDDESSSDISFNLQLLGNTTPITATVVRGPYLQQATDHSMIVKWRTDVACDSKVSFGMSMGSLSLQAVDPAFSTEHEVHITGLDPYTIYYYNIGHAGADLTAPSSQMYFLTAPVMGTAGKYRFWVVGDAGMGNDNMRAARNGFVGYSLGQQVDGWIWLGDNAYEGGFDDEYQDHVFSNDTYEQLLKRIVVWPAIGNHDYNNHIPFSPSPAYYDIFTLPSGGECGGLASGTEKYYSYNYGNIHFIVLDSYDEDRDATAPMATWLTNDLAANTQPWVIAYWHHPPYTKGSHNSDNSTFLDWEIVDIRENIIPILENAGVDLILNGHSHSYERSMLIDGHYGYSSSFGPSHVVNGTSGDYITDCPYTKNTEISPSHKGTVYAVVGCSGKLGSTSSGWPHPVMSRYSDSELGSMIFEVQENRLDAKFIKADSTIFDQFTIIKNAGKNTLIQACPGDEVTLHPSWPGAHVWEPSGAPGDSLTITALLNTTYYVTDSLNCIRDTFDIDILPSPPCSIVTGMNEITNVNGVHFFLEHHQLVTTFEQAGQEPATLIILDAGGKTVLTEKISTGAGPQRHTTDLGTLTSGFYIVSFSAGNDFQQQKIVITH